MLDHEHLRLAQLLSTYLSEREVWSSFPGSVKSTQYRHQTFLRSCVARALSSGDGPASSFGLYGGQSKKLIFG